MWDYSLISTTLPQVQLVYLLDLPLSTRRLGLALSVVLLVHFSIFSLHFVRFQYTWTMDLTCCKPL
ncbi:hypothetical protein Sjap_004679 [Stephania japonica]|uniref:Uncharacterized protein n=1 Tax=Stephania japonica TaxID=461633 RepID=A0AAP0PL47_9MAGN